jgi:hypothetical protein
MAHHYLWGSKALNIANSTIYGQERNLVRQPIPFIEEADVIMYR